MDPKTERVAKAICARERGGVDQCKTCRQAHYQYNPETAEDDFIDLGEGCLGFGYEYLAAVAIQATEAALTPPT